MTAVTAKAQLAWFIAKYSPTLARDGRAALKKMRQLVPGAVELVYDNYNWLVVGFAPNERPSDAVFSLAFAPRWVTLCFLQSAADLPDPDHLLRGSGKVVRSIRLATAADLDQPAIRALISEALAREWSPVDRRLRGKIVIRSVSARQRPRRP